MGEHRECLIQSNVLSKWFNISLNWVSFYDQAEWVRYSLGIKCSSMWWKLTPSEHQGVNGKLFLLRYRNELNCQLITSQGVPNLQLQLLNMSWEESVYLLFICHLAESSPCFVLFAFPSSRPNLRCVCRTKNMNTWQTSQPSISWLSGQQYPSCHADRALLLFQCTECFTVKIRVLVFVFSGTVTA